MPRKFAKHAAVTHDLTLHRFSPGDEVPEWLEVGEHVLEPEKETTFERATPIVDAEDETTSEVQTVVAEEQGTPAPVPDFTQPAPEKRGPGRPRKS